MVLDFLVFTLQEGGRDSGLMTLRQVIQQCESSGLVDMELGGHTYSRPAAVVQGLSADWYFGIALSTVYLFFSGFAYSFHCMFFIVFPFAFRIEVAPKTGSTMLWRPNQIQFSGLRATNAASFFLSNLLEESPVLKKAQTVFPQIHTHIYVYNKRCSR